MMHLRLQDGTITTNPSEMRKLAMDFYSGLFSAGSGDSDCVAEILEGLPQLGEAQ